METIRTELRALSGGSKRRLTRKRLYSSITLEGLDDLPAERDTLQRFSDFGIPDDLSGYEIIDLGSNAGAMAFEACKRGATVRGYEYTPDRVTLCRAIASRYDLDAHFFQVDFNNDDLSGIEPADILLCCSVHHYIDDQETFFDWMFSLLKPGGVLYLEDNAQWREPFETLAILKRHGFHEYTHLGDGHTTGTRRKRRIFEAVKP